MKINKNVSNSIMNISLEGRLDTITAPELENEINNAFEGITQVNLDFASLDYISSAGLRVILGIQKQMNKQGGEMIIKNVCPEIMDVFEITGFSDIMNIE